VAIFSTDLYCTACFFQVSASSQRFLSRPSPAGPGQMTTLRRRRRRRRRLPGARAAGQQPLALGRGPSRPGHPANANLRATWLEVMYPTDSPHCSLHRRRELHPHTLTFANRLQISSRTATRVVLMCCNALWRSTSRSSPGLEQKRRSKPPTSSPHRSSLDAIVLILEESVLGTLCRHHCFPAAVRDEGHRSHQGVRRGGRRHLSAEGGLVS